MKPEMNVLGIDIAKHVFHAVGMDDRGNVVSRKRLSRHDLMPFLAKLPPVRIGIEACGGAHYRNHRKTPSFSYGDIRWCLRSRQSISSEVRGVTMKPLALAMGRSHPAYCEWANSRRLLCQPSPLRVTLNAALEGAVRSTADALR